MTISDDAPFTTAAGTLLFECLAEEPARRTAALERLCRLHPDRATALRSLFEQLDGYGLLDEPLAEPAAGERFGPYRLRGILGAGGMGTVHLAIHETLGRCVALKVIHSGLAAPPDARERFQREIQALGSLDHPNICPIHDAGEIDGIPFLALRLVDGETLQQRIERQRQANGTIARTSVHEVVALGEKLARALHAAHEQGLVHRDVKPGNVMIDTATGEPLLLDFGLARLVDSEAPALTLSSDRLGTPAYMAPEQVEGRPADRRTDVYALAATLHEALTLRPLHDAPTRQALYRRILDGEITRARHLDRRIGRDLDLVLATGLERDPERRYATAAAFADDLQRVLRRQPILARRAGVLLRSWRFAQRNPLPTAFLVVAAAAALAFALLLQRSERTLRTATANEQALRARDMLDTAPRRATAAALAAVEQQKNVDTISVLQAAVVADHEALRLHHEKSVWVTEFSPDGELVLSCSEDGTARLWRRDGTLHAELPHEGHVWHAEFDPQEGQRVVTVSADGTVVLWERSGQRIRTLWQTASTGFMRAMLRPDGDPIPTHARFSADSRRVVVACLDRKARVFDVRSGAQIGPEFAHEGLLFQAAWSRTGLIATTEGCGEMNFGDMRFAIRVWRPGAEHHEVLLSRELPASICAAEFAPAGDAVAVACRDCNAYVFDVVDPAAREKPSTARAEPIVLAHGGPVWRARFSPDGLRILTTSFDHTVCLWDRQGNRLQSARQRGQVADAAFSADGSRIVTTARDNTVRLHDADLRELLVLHGHSEWPFMARISPDGRRVASAGWDNTVRLWELLDPRIPRLLGHTARVRGLARGTDGSLLSVADDRTLRHWDLRTGAAVAIPLSATPIAVVAAPDARSVLVTHEDGVARRYDLRTGSVLAVYPDLHGIWINATFTSDGSVLTAGAKPALRLFGLDGSDLGRWGEPGKARGRTQAMAAAPRRRAIATVGWYRELMLWSEDQTLVADVPIVPAERAIGAWQWSYAVAFSPAEDRIAVGSGDGVARIFDLRDLRPVDADAPMVLDGHEGSVLAIAWSPDGALLATAASDGAARLWDTITGRLLQVLRDPGGAVCTVLFAADGRLVTGSTEGGIQFWLTAEDEIVELARLRTRR